MHTLVYVCVSKHNYRKAICMQPLSILRNFLLSSKELIRAKAAKKGLLMTSVYDSAYPLPERILAKPSRVARTLAVTTWLDVPVTT